LRARSSQIVSMARNFSRAVIRSSGNSNGFIAEVSAKGEEGSMLRPRLGASRSHKTLNGQSHSGVSTITSLLATAVSA
jgi:hypothetical protein